MSHIPTPGRARTALFVLIVMFGSFLLFIVQPLVARLALPLLGGAPGVWNSAMMVFQTLLLGGYAYAHAIGRLTLRRQAMVHLGLLAISVATLPVALPDIAGATPGWEALWAPLLFLAAVGPVFLLLSAQASLMQRWYAALPGAGDPYRLYAASNLGSFGGLVAYPFLVEPRMTLSGQSSWWSGGFIVLILLVATAAFTLRKGGSDDLGERSRLSGEGIGRGRILTWLALAAVPSGLMLSTTTLLTTDLMAMPLLWVIPLGLYLLSFTVAFSPGGDWVRIIGNVTPVLLLAVGGLALLSGGQAGPAIALAMVALLFVLSVALHGRLYALRPDPSKLTFFYLVLAAGGAIGGIFTALVAPLLFDWVYEHALLLLAAALLIPRRNYLALVSERWGGISRGPRLAMVLVAFAAMLAAMLGFAVENGLGLAILCLVIALVALGVLLADRRAAFTAVLGLLMLGHGGYSTLSRSFAGERTRSYFGVYSTETARNGAMLRLNHGTTMHGEQWRDPARRNRPTAYYGRSSGIGVVLSAARPDARIGIVGLGVGTLACYRNPGQTWTFFEIDPDVLRYSRDGTFTFLRDCAPDADIVIGDARLSLAERAGSRMDILAIDAFTSDAIPMHLLTEEAFAVYGKALATDGLLLVHISNRFVDLAPMVAALGRQGGWHGLMREDFTDLDEGLSASDWVVLSRDRAALTRLRDVERGKWQALPAPSATAWTDDYASLIALF